MNNKLMYMFIGFFLVLTTTLATTPSSNAVWWNDSYAYKQPLYINMTNATGVIAAGYEVTNITINDATKGTNFDFANECIGDNTTRLVLVDQYETTQLNWTMVWCNTTTNTSEFSINMGEQLNVTNSTYWIYYGETGKTPISNNSAVFDQHYNWETCNDGGFVWDNDGVEIFSTVGARGGCSYGFEGDGGAGPSSTMAFPDSDGKTLRMDVWFNCATCDVQIISGDADTTATYDQSGIRASTGMKASYYDTAARYGTTTYAPGNWYILEYRNVNFGATSFEMWIDNELELVAGKFSTRNLETGNMALRGSAASNKFTLFDNIIIRDYDYDEANMTITLGAEESPLVVIPTTTLNTPADSSTDNDGVVTFNCSATDNSLISNMTLWHNGTGTWHANITNTSVTGLWDFMAPSVTFSNGNTVLWNCLTVDNDSQTDWADANYTVNINITEISSCINITLSGSYTITQNINSSDAQASGVDDFVCINISADDVILDCQNFLIEGNDTYSVSYESKGILANNSLGTNNAIKNCRVKGFWEPIKLENSDYYNISNCTIYTTTPEPLSGPVDYGVRIDNSSYNTIQDCTFDNPNVGFGNYYTSHHNIIERNTIVDTSLFCFGSSDTCNNNTYEDNICDNNRDDGGIIWNNTNLTFINNSFQGNYEGIRFQDCDNVTFTNNTLGEIKTASNYGIKIIRCTEFNVTGGTISTDAIDYVLEDIGIDQVYFRNTNFTDRDIKFIDSTSWFSYSNESSGDIWLDSQVSGATTLTRELITWESGDMKWNETNTSGSGIIVTYNISGLNASTTFKVYNNSVDTYTLSTDASGTLESFNISLNGESEIRVLEYNVYYPQWSSISTTGSNITNSWVSLSATWSCEENLSGYIFSWNNSGSWVNDSWVAMPSNNITSVLKKINSTVGTDVGWRFYANSSTDNLNVTDIQVLTTVASTTFWVRGATYKQSYANNSIVELFVFAMENSTTTMLDKRPRGSSYFNISYKVMYPDDSIIIDWTNLTVANSTNYTSFTFTTNGTIGVYKIELKKVDDASVNYTMNFYHPENDTLPFYRENLIDLANYIHSRYNFTSHEFTTEYASYGESVHILMRAWRHTGNYSYFNVSRDCINYTTFLDDDMYGLSAMSEYQLWSGDTQFNQTIQDLAYLVYVWYEGYRDFQAGEAAWTEGVAVEATGNTTFNTYMNTIVNDLATSSDTWNDTIDTWEVVGSGSSADGMWAATLTGFAIYYNDSAEYQNRATTSMNLRVPEFMQPYTFGSGSVISPFSTLPTLEDALGGYPGKFTHYSSESSILSLGLYNSTGNRYWLMFASPQAEWLGKSQSTDGSYYDAYPTGGAYPEWIGMWASWVLHQLPVETYVSPVNYTINTEITDVVWYEGINETHINVTTDASEIGYVKAKLIYPSESISVYIDDVVTSNYSTSGDIITIWFGDANRNLILKNGEFTSTINITIDSPSNTTYTSAPININVTTSEFSDACLYNLNGGTNTTLLNDSMINWFTTTTPASNGLKQLNIYCNDTAGSMSLNDTIWFTYTTQYACDSCADCTNYLTNSSLSTGGTVTLAADITGSSGLLGDSTDAGESCIVFNTSSLPYTFDCDGYTISGDGDIYGYGIWLNETDDHIIQGCSNISYFDRGIQIPSDNNTIYNSTIWGNSVPYTGTPCASGYGMYISGELNNITSVNTSQNCLKGIYLVSLGNNTFDYLESRYNPTTSDIDINSDYNNLTNSLIDGLDLGTSANYNNIYNNNITSTAITGSDNYFNTTKTLATSIVGGPYIGGNYWGSAYTGNDWTDDGIGDTNHTVDSSPLTYDDLPLVLGDFGNITANTSDNNQNWTFSTTPGDEELINLNFTSTGNTNNTIYFTLHEDLDNTTLVSVNSSINLSLDDWEFSTINISINVSAPAGTYSGNLTWTSYNDSTQTGNITIYFTISAQAGDVNITATSWAAAWQSGSTYNLNLNVSNEGNYNLSHCNWSLSTTISASAAYSQNDFVVENTTEVTTTITFSGSTVGTDASASLTLTCDATAGGSDDSETVTGTIAVSAAGGGGGGDGDPGDTIIVQESNITLGYEVGDGVCQSAAGENAFNSADCRLDISQNAIQLTVVLATLLGIAYVVISSKKKKKKKKPSPYRFPLLGGK